MTELPPIPQIPCRYCGDVTASQTCGACAFRLWSGENRCTNVVYGDHTCVLELDHPESVPCVSVDGRRGAEPTGRFRCDGPPLVFEAKSLDPDVRDDLKERADTTPGVCMSVRRDVMKALLIERDRLAAVVNRMVLEKTAPAEAPAPMTQEEKIAYRLAWDARVEEGKRKK